MITLLLFHCFRKGGVYPDGRVLIRMDIGVICRPGHSIVRHGSTHVRIPNLPNHLLPILPKNLMATLYHRYNIPINSIGAITKKIILVIKSFKGRIMATSGNYAEIKADPKLTYRVSLNKEHMRTNIDVVFFGGGVSYLCSSFLLLSRLIFPFGHLWRMRARGRFGIYVCLRRIMIMRMFQGAFR